MGIAAPEQVKTPFWCTFPAHAITGVDWNDHEQAHRAVMKLFPQKLPGPPGRVRSEAGILFRNDAINGVPTILVQSDIPPELLPAQARTMSVPDDVWRIEDGSLIEFRVAVNPVRRFRNHTRPVHGDEFDAWIAERIEHALGDVKIANIARRMTTASKGQRQLSLATVDGIANVIDGQALEKLRHDGVGRSKSYGAGLLTARRIG